jgi:uncharacterized protein YbjT (DUF2867 family)
MATIAVMGANGNIGSKLAARLLGGGHHVRALGRSAEKLAGLKAKGAEVLLGDAADAAFLTRAFRGADAAFTLLPPNMVSTSYLADMRRTGEAIAAAAADAGLKHLLALSSVGADRPSGTGPIAGLHAHEERLRGIAAGGVNVLALRPGYFFENTLGVIGLIKHQGINGGAMAPETTLPMIATADIADAAARALAARDWTGFQVRELLGPRDYTQAEVTRMIGGAIGRPDLAYVRFPYGEYAAALVQAGLSQDVARLYAELEKALDDGLVTSVEGRSAANTTPTTFEQFAAEVFAPAYAAA